MARRVGGVPQEGSGCWGELRCKMRFAIVTLHHLDRPLLEVDWGALRGLDEVVMVLWVALANCSGPNNAESQSYIKLTR